MYYLRNTGHTVSKSSRMDSRTISDHSRNTLDDRLLRTQQITGLRARLQGGFTITKKTTAKMENQSFTCSNPKCARVFTNPIIVQDLSSQNEASYSACPHCLAEIAIEKDLEIKIKQAKTTLKEVKPTQQPPAIHKCPHHFGYLSQRSKNENILEECMTCAKLLECMLSGSK